VSFFHEYRPHRFGRASAAIVNAANQIIAQYSEQGYVLTLRQLYYRFIAMDLFPESWIDERYNQAHGLAPRTKNTEKNYQRLGAIITKGREAGYIDWEGIEDRSREAVIYGYNEDPKSGFKGLERRLNWDLWMRQDTYIEVWVEKDALVAVIERACGSLRLNHLACKGYLSTSEAWRGGMRFETALAKGKQCVMIHLGDHDPSGLDMTQDNTNRLEMFVPDGVTVERIALNMNQVRQFNPPPNPAKVRDSRFAKYQKEFGNDSWELDALEPAELNKIIEEAVEKYIDRKEWDKALTEEKKAKEELKKFTDGIVDNYEEAKKCVAKHVAAKAKKEAAKEKKRIAAEKRKKAAERKRLAAKAKRLLPKRKTKMRKK